MLVGRGTKVHAYLHDSWRRDTTVTYYVNNLLHYIIWGRMQKFVLPSLCPNLNCNERILEYLYPSLKKRRAPSPYSLVAYLYTMDISHSIHSEVSSLSFSFLSADDIKAISVKKVDNPILLDNLNLPTRGGLYDPKLGPMGSRDL